MANSIVGGLPPGELNVRLKNSLMSLFINLLSTSASKLARTDSEIRLATGISCADQSIIGRGCVGFDVRDLPWSRTQSEFDTDIEYVLKTVEPKAIESAAGTIAYFHKLDWLRESFENFAELVRRLEIEDVERREMNIGLFPDVVGHRCDLHRVYLHAHGCVVCNDQLRAFKILCQSEKS